MTSCPRSRSSGGADGVRVIQHRGDAVETEAIHPILNHCPRAPHPPTYIPSASASSIAFILLCLLPSGLSSPPSPCRGFLLHRAFGRMRCPCPCIGTR